MVGLGYALRSVMGIATLLDGLGATASTPVADLKVNIGTGSILKYDAVDGTAFGDLGNDTQHSIVKQGLLETALALTITPPATIGYSQVFLVQAAYQDEDAGQGVLNYYNAADPTMPFAGPANSGISQYTVRKGKCIVSLKAGAAATTGTQTTPTPDAGFIGLYAVTVANGATQINSGNIVRLLTAPFVDTKLPDVPQAVQSGKWIFATDTGTANALVIAPTPTPVAAVNGMTFLVKKNPAVAANTVANPTIDFGFGAKTIKRRDGTALNIGDLVASMYFLITYNGTDALVLTSLPSDLSTNVVRAIAMNITRVVISATGAFSWTVPAGVTRIWIKGWSGGGGGGGAVNGTPGGAASGGGSGAYFSKVLSVTPGDLVTGNIGAGGSQGTSGANGGGGGATTITVGGTTYTINGGAGGLSATAGVQQNAVSGGSFPTGGDDTSRAGNVGVNGIFSHNGSASNASGGYGAPAPYGGNGGIGGPSNGANGAAPGGGGGGGAGVPGSVVNGGSGARGEVWFEY